MPAEKIGRNDRCYCGSGKKYKFCCMVKTEPTVQRTDSPFPTVSEPVARDALLGLSQPFRASYEAERSKLITPIAWTNGILMPPEIQVQPIRLPTPGLQAIYLRRIPAATEQALAVAHEMMHLMI